MTLAVVQSFRCDLKAMHGISFEAATIRDRYMLCGAVGMFIGVLLRPRAQTATRGAWAIGGGAVLLAICGTGWLDGTATMGGGGHHRVCGRYRWPSRDMRSKRPRQRAPPVGFMGWCIRAWTRFCISPIVLACSGPRGTVKPAGSHACAAVERGRSHLRRPASVARVKGLMGPNSIAGMMEGFFASFPEFFMTDNCLLPLRSVKTLRQSSLLSLGYRCADAVDIPDAAAPAAPKRAAKPDVFPVMEKMAALYPTLFGAVFVPAETRHLPGPAGCPPR